MNYPEPQPQKADQGVEAMQAEQSAPMPGIDSAGIGPMLAELRFQQNMLLGVAAGTAATLLGAALWAAVTVFSGYQIGWMAVGVGVLVGLAVRTFGKGIDKSFGFAGAGLALLGCMIGNILAICGLVSIEEGASFFQILGRLNPGVTIRMLVATFSPIDLLFYGLAVYEGYKFSFRQVTEEDLPGERAESTA